MASKTGPTNRSNPKTSASDGVVTEETVCVEFCAPIDTQLLTSHPMKFLGLDTDQVMLQICGNTFFCGQLDHTFGTNVLFEVKSKDKSKKCHNTTNTESDATAATPDDQSVEYMAKCDRKLVMKRVFLEPLANQSDNTSTQQQPNQ